MQRLARRTALPLVAVALAACAGSAAAHTPRPDLVVARVSNPPATIGTGGAFRVSDRTVNRGDGVAGRSTTRYFIARSAAGSIDDEKGVMLRGSRTVEAIIGGAAGTGAREAVVPDVPAGTYDLVACADARNRVRESNERNNCRAAARQMRVRANALPAVFIGGGAMTGAVVDEGGPPALAAPQLTLTDTDDTRFVEAKAAIGAGGAGLYFLFFIPEGANQITGTYDSGTGVLTLRGNAPVADYEKALRSIWVGFAGDDPRGSETIVLSVRDAKGAWSKPARRTVTVNPVNDPPHIAFAGPPSSKEAIGSSIAVYDPDSEIAGATLRSKKWEGPEFDADVNNLLGITGTYDSGTGVLTLTGTTSARNYQTVLRTVSYRNKSGQGPGSFEFQVTDAAGATSNILPYIEQQP